MSTTTNHICYDELTNLENNPLKGHYDFLIVGTFNPDIKKNEAKWFYGRSESEFWFLLPRMLGRTSLHHADNEELEDDQLCHEWKTFTTNESILIIDLFKSIESDPDGYKDSEFDKKEVKVNPLNYKNTFEHLTFRTVLFTFLGPPSKDGNISKYMHELKDCLSSNNKVKSIGHLLSPSPLSRGGRKKKLEQWREVYNRTKLLSLNDQ